jgi:hypothetical protein
MKLTCKETKDGSMTVLILGFIDCYDELIKIHIAGRMAFK